MIEFRVCKNKSAGRLVMADSILDRFEKTIEIEKQIDDTVKLR